MHMFTNLTVLGLSGIALIGFSSFQVFAPVVTFLLCLFLYLVFLLVSFLNTRAWLENEHHLKIRVLSDRYERKIRRLKNEYDTATLEKTIREGTKTLIKNAVDYLKIENIKKEMPPSAAIQNLQLDKYGQIIELLADFSLILPDYEENRRIVEKEITHQIQIYEIDEKLFAEFLKTILSKYHLTVTKKMRERLQLAASRQRRVCPQCREAISIKSTVCGYCGHDLTGRGKPASKPRAERRKSPPDPNAGAGAGTVRELAPGDELEWVRRGKALYESGAYHDAIRLLTRAISLNPNAVQAYYARGVIFTRLDQTDRAERDFLTADKMGHPKAQQALSALKFSETQEEWQPDADASAS